LDNKGFNYYWCAVQTWRPSTSLFWQYSGICLTSEETMGNLKLCSRMVLHANRWVDFVASWEVLPCPMWASVTFFGTGDVHIVQIDKGSADIAFGLVCCCCCQCGPASNLSFHTSLVRICCVLQFALQLLGCCFRRLQPFGRPASSGWMVVEVRLHTIFTNFTASLYYGDNYLDDNDDPATVIGVLVSLPQVILWQWRNKHTVFVFRRNFVCRRKLCAFETLCRIF